MNWKRSAAIQRHIAFTDKWLLACLTWLPIALALCIWAIFRAGIATNLPIGVVDLSHSSLSQQLTRTIDASPTLAINASFSDVSAAKQALIQGDVYAYVVIPTQFDRDTMNGFAPQISAFYNSQYVLVGKLIHSALSQAHATFNAKLAVAGKLKPGNATLASAAGKALPIRSQVTALFNLNSNYAQFLVSAIVPALWQIMIVVVTIMILAANQRQRGLRPWLSPSPVKQLILTLTPYVPVFFAHGAAFITGFYLWLDWPFHGQIWLVLLAQFVTIIACMIMGALFYFVTLDSARAMSFAGAFTAPSFAFMGITFPVTDMNAMASVWRSLLPVSHYIEVQLGQASYGENWIASIEKMAPMLGYLLPAFGIWLLMQRQLRKAEASQ